MADTETLVRIAGVVEDLHAKSGPTWSRFKLCNEDNERVWATAKFGVERGDVIVAEAVFNTKFRSYDVKRLVDQATDGDVSNLVVRIKIINELPGVGKAKADKLCEKFPDLFKTITTDPTAVADFIGAKPEDVKYLAESLSVERGQLSRVSELVNLGWPQSLAKQISSNDQQYRVAIKNPYAAIRLVTGLGWLKADEIGRKQGIVVDDPERIKAGIDHWYYENVRGDGHTITDAATLLGRDGVPTLLGLKSSQVEAYLDQTLVALGNGHYTTAGQRKNAEIVAQSFLG